jgi:hypothetical protein
MRCAGWRRRRSIACFVALLASETPAWAQTAYFDATTEEYVEIRPWVCPYALSPGYRWNPYGFPQEYEGRRYWFPNEWRQSLIGTGASEANYWAYPNPDPLDDTRELQWVGAGHRQKCTVETRTRNGRTSTTYHFKQLAEYGYLRRVFSGDDECGGDAGLDHEIYDAGYDPTQSGGTCGGDGGGEESGGSGIQYQPGDYTGGETVSWEDGTGNGGTSVCGDQAKVEYICIDVYNEETGSWEEWSCGYATTC